MAKIYCAGPLFNAAERREMEMIAHQLEQAGHTTFLPHRDGLEFAKIQGPLIKAGFEAREAGEILGRAIFSVDIYQLTVEAEAVVVNLNGRVPDEGTIVEAAIAWHAGKTVLLYKNDARSKLNGTDNPMVAGLGGFRTVSELPELLAALGAELQRDKKQDVKKTLTLGKELSDVREELETAGVVQFLVQRFQKGHAGGG